jgi:hypothetical protein
MVIDPKPWKHIKSVSRIEWENRLRSWREQIQASDALPTVEDHIMLATIAFWLLMTLSCWGILFLLVVMALG